jgi:hypothetical protein
LDNEQIIAQQVLERLHQLRLGLLQRLEQERLLWLRCWPSRLHRLLVQLQWQQQAQAQPLVREWPPPQRGQAQRLRRLGLVLALSHGNKHPSQSG